MPVYKTNRTAESYGQAIGILLLDTRAPFIPGDVGNATTYNYPVIYKLVSGLTVKSSINGAPEFNDAMVAAARALVAQGVRGISSDCGFMFQYQDVVRDAVDVPVCLSSMFQLPFIARTMEPTRPIGVITAHSSKLTLDFLRRAGIEAKNPIVIQGMQDGPEFRAAILEEKGTLDSDLINAETIRVAERMVAEHPEMGAILLECSMLPPYAKAVQEAVGLPVYDFITMIDYLQSGTHQQTYAGYM